jgi:hypothetical protein
MIFICHSEPARSGGEEPACHPERRAFCVAKDLGAPRESPALFAGD